MAKWSSEKFEFENQAGQTLAGLLERPAGPPVGYALFAHCFTCSKNVHAATRVARHLSRRGFVVLRFDFTGLGNSEGEFSNTDFSSNVDDLICAASAMAQREQAPGLLIGHSLGGSAILAAAGQIESVCAVATINAPSEPAHVVAHFENKVEEIQQTGKAHVRLGGRDFAISKQFLDDVTSVKVLDQVANLKKPLMIFHSPIDSVVSIEHARDLYQSAKHPKSFISLDNADHLLTNPADAEFVASTLASWAQRYVERENQRQDDQQSHETQGQVFIREAGQSYTQSIQAGSHLWTADEPPSVGGQDAGPTPYDLLLSALGACTVITVRMYANKKKWPIEQISASLDHQKVHADDCADCESKTGHIDQMNLTLHIEGPLSDDQRKKLLEIAHKCPVHRTLTNEKVINVKLGD